MTHSQTRLRLSILGSLALGAALSQAQVIRTETQVVLVDVVATDKKGKFVRDLDGPEFRVWEDGKEQKITSAARETKTGAAQGPGSSNSRHYVVLLFDNASLTPGELALAGQAAQSFVDHGAATAPREGNRGGPLTAVVSYSTALRVAQGFTEDTTRIKQAITRVLTTSSAASTTPTPGLFGGTPDTPADTTTRETIRTLETLVQKLEFAPGRKTLIWFTPGVALTPTYEPMLNRVIDAANRSNIAIYPVSMRATAIQSATRLGRSDSGGRSGLSGPNPLTSGSLETASQTQAQNDGTSALIQLADKSGGFLIRQSTDEAALAKAGSEQSEYYLLGYTPPASAPGSCHKLRVEVKRKNVELRSRAEYCNRAAPNLVSANPVEKALETRALNSTATASGDSKATNTISAAVAAVPFYTSPNIARVVVALSANLENIAFARDKGKFVSSINVLGLARKADGSTAARFSDVVKFEFSTQADVDGFKRETYRYDSEFEIASGDYTLTVALGSGPTDAGGSFGQLAIPLRIEPYQAADFKLSGLALSRSLRAPSEVAATLDSLGVSEHKRLIANGAELMLAPSNRVPRAQPASVYFELNDPLLASTATRATTQIALQMRVLDRRTGAAKADTGLARLDLAATGFSVENGTGIVPVALPIPIQKLTPGSYVLELQVADTAGHQARQTVNFDIE